ncbi:hypothetical protein FO440_04080 [Mucilaginibacter corticis]|uniref:Uncharacterized protein n=1 Tax=Mucilaginibacter corticis TaxID=2597670 RepID=A0A556MTV2_9SPHI|nr:hypothetical protein [Mucilaginibacter corticis]TSJ43381.1 hypothetical protein FO440_04080 [Mucilaginibacter corticis]
MKKTITIFFSLLISAIVVKAQSALFNRIDSLDRRPLVIINGKTVDPLSFLALDEQDFQDVKVFTREEAMKIFGDSRGRFGAVKVTLVKNAKIFTWAELVKRFYFIPSQVPRINARLNYLDFVDPLQFNDSQSFITSLSTVTGMGIYMWGYPDCLPDNPMILVYLKSNILYKKDKTPGPFDKEIEAIKQNFYNESSKRQEIRSAKTTIRG